METGFEEVNKEKKVGNDMPTLYGLGEYWSTFFSNDQTNKDGAM